MAGAKSGRLPTGRTDLVQPRWQAWMRRDCPGISNSSCEQDVIGAGDLPIPEKAQPLTIAAGETRNVLFNFSFVDTLLANGFEGPN